jgi:PEGA domain
MTRLAIGSMLIVLFVISTVGVVDAQRGGGGAARSGGGSAAGVGGAGGMIPPSSGRGNGAGRGGFRIQGRVNVPPTLPSINRPSFPIDGLNRPAFPLSGPLGFGRAQRSPFDARRGTYTRLQPFGGIPYGYGGYGYGYDAPAYGDSYVPESTYEKLYRTPEPPITEGALLFDVTPATALVYIDNAYVGNVADLQTSGLTLPGGRHWVDLEAPNYDKKTFEVTIRAGEPLRYRFDMTPTRRAEVIPASPRPPQTLYVVAGCYAGNRPPVAVNLPKGCDVAKVRIIRPQAALVR